MWIDRFEIHTTSVLLIYKDLQELVVTEIGVRVEGSLCNMKNCRIGNSKSTETGRRTSINLDGHLKTKGSRIRIMKS